MANPNVFEKAKQAQDERLNGTLHPKPLQRDMEAATDYPIDALGSILAPAAKAIIDGMKCPPALAGQSLLASASLAVQGFANVEIDGRCYPLSENFMTIGLSGERKSAVDRIANYPHRHREKAKIDVFIEDKKAFKSAKRAYDAATAQAEKAAKKGGGTAADFAKALAEVGDEPQAPIEPYLLCTEPTYPALIKLLANGQASMGLFTDEGGSFLGGHAMSSDNALSTISGLSKLWDGDPVDRIRVGDGAEKLYGRRLSVHLMAQPIIGLKMLADELYGGQGFLARFLVTYPETTAGTRLYCETDITQHQAVRRYTARMMAILETPLPMMPDDPQQLDPRKLPLSPDAKIAWVDIHNHIESSIAPKGKLAEIRPFASKAAEHTARLAGILALVDNIHAENIGEQHIEQAWQLMSHYIQECLRLTGSFEPDNSLAKAEKLGEWLAKYKAGLSVCLQQVYRESTKCARSAKAARALLAILDEHDWVRKQPEDTRIDYNGKSTGEVYRVAALEALREVISNGL